MFPSNGYNFTQTVLILTQNLNWGESQVTEQEKQWERGCYEINENKASTGNLISMKKVF